MKNNDFENIYCKSIGLPRDTSYETYDPEQTFFDGDLDALAKEIKSEEAMLSYAETFANITEYNAAQKIKMCKKLKVVTRGHTKYHESMENFLDSQIYSLEEEKEAAPSGNGKSLKDIWASKSAWYIKIWESIKHIWSKIVQFVKELIGKFVNWWKGRSKNGNDIKQLEDLSNDPEALKRIGDWFNSSDWEFKSDHGTIPVNADVIKNLKASLDDFTRNTGIPMKFRNAVNETVRAQAINSEVVGRVNEITAELANFLHVHLPPKFSTNKKEDIQHIKVYMNKFKEDIEYNRDPARFVKQFTGADLLPKDAKPEDVFGNNIKISLHDTSEQVAKKIGPILKGFINKQRTLDEVLEHLEKDIMGPYNTLSKDLEESHKIFINWMKNQKVVKNDQGEINENYKTDNESNDVTAFACVEAITGLYNCITRTLNIYNEIVKQVIDYCKKFETIKQKFISFGNSIKNTVKGKFNWVVKPVLNKLKNIKDKKERESINRILLQGLDSERFETLVDKYNNVKGPDGKKMEPGTPQYNRAIRMAFEEVMQTEKLDQFDKQTWNKWKQEIISAFESGDDYWNVDKVSVDKKQTKNAQSFADSIQKAGVIDNDKGSIADYNAYAGHQHINLEEGKKAGHPGSDGSVSTSKDQVASGIQRLKDKKKQLNKQNKKQSQDSWYWY